MFKKKKKRTEKSGKKIKGYFLKLVSSFAQETKKKKNDKMGNIPKINKK